ncbi:hypothetical protein N7G274_006153 [Stereocaulon virgatum]|uniref:Uncharacterized protein n=1 Tax=Stereocaulon virgatum TaxID=373712 RepID=A0ABR4A823_9LECA
MLHRLLGASKAKSNVQMFLASRKETDIGKSMGSANRLEIRPFHLEKDISSYVRVQVGALEKRFDLPTERQKRIVTEITMRAHGMFLLARLIMDNLLDQICHEDLEEELRSEILPKGINQAYARILFRMQKGEHSTRRWEISKLGLDILTMIKRPIKNMKYKQPFLSA